MSRPLRGSSSDSSTIHSLKSDTDGFEVHSGDISLSPAAAAFTIADTIEAWLEAMQRQINTLTGTTPVLARQLAGLWQEQPGQEQSLDRQTYQPDAQQGAGTQLLP